ncbi:DUF6660 family protein [Flagellimonas zhangzhouensis]|uniref:Uncharacterized protein n=1 Tax=Flagellimonas zhangzhouensis TaxID=1073328 RepID=A0A1H2XRM6_9FLAO|nr:DUF6660 family protein [Allomuricauda zhangzhouensis]SDW95551.1 hypothetical protein SAMN04487892_2792 [Allomuricauda zhangzhouensis]
MKLLALILSLYFLGLNGLPCNDCGGMGDDEEKVSIVDHGGDHDSTCGLCSPFCKCHCCHVHSLYLGTTAFEPITHSIVRENFIHFDGPARDVTPSLFQPPRY